MTDRPPKETLRKGWTTGACATAAVTAAYGAILTGRFQDPVTITLPRGETPSFPLSRAELSAGCGTAGIIKDAGDDPDVTHGAEIIATVSLGQNGSGVTFHAGGGVGTVTLPGLPVGVGEAAINPAPRAMMTDAVEKLAAVHGAPGDAIITISVPGGEALAEKTMNGRLGIRGGISILGTTGVVIPYSCSSWIHSIHSGIDVARAGGIDHIAGATGRTSEAAVARLLDLPETALIDMGDFAGGMLKYLRRHPVERLTIAGGFAKLVKLAQGNLYLHSSASSVDMAALAGQLAELGAGEAAVERARKANTAAEVMDIAGDEGVALASRIARRAREVALATLSGHTAVEVMVFDRKGELAGQSMSQSISPSENRREDKAHG